LTYTLIDDSLNGTVTVHADGSFIYIPAPDFHGEDRFSFQVTDGQAISTANVTLTVDSVNDAPVATGSSELTDEDTPFNGSVSASDADADLLTYSVVTNPAHGSVTLDLDTGTYHYTPVLNYNGPDSFTFKANDGVSNSNAATIALSVTAVNDAPVAQSQSLTINAGTALNGTVTATDLDSAALTYHVLTNPTHGTLTLNITTGVFRYNPEPGFSGSDSFAFQANDQFLNSNTATVSVTVSQSNIAPIAQNQSFAVNEDTTHSGSSIATDADSSTLTYSVVANPTHGSLTFDNATGAYSYTPAQDYNGPDSFTYQASDGAANSNTAIVAISVTPVNDAPLITAQTFALPENTPNGVVVGTVQITDVDVGDTKAFTITGGTGSSAFAIDNSGIIKVADTLQLDFETTTSFTLVVQVADSHGATSTATMTINLTDVLPAVQLKLGGPAVTWTKKQAPVSVLPLATVSSTSSLAGGTLSINVDVSGTKKKSLDLFRFPSATALGNSQGAQYSLGHISLTIQLQEGVTDAQIQAYLRGITFSTAGKGLKSLTRSLNVTLENSHGTKSSLVRTINVHKK
jgi:hypothetical protein